MSTPYIKRHITKLQPHRSSNYIIKIMHIWITRVDKSAWRRNRGIVLNLARLLRSCYWRIRDCHWLWLGKQCMPTILHLYSIRKNHIVLSRTNGHLYGFVHVVQETNITLRKHTIIVINKDKYMLATSMSPKEWNNIVNQLGA